MITAKQQDAHERQMVKRLHVWITQAKAMIDDTFDDARSHLDRACSEALKTTEDGRPTAVKARASRSVKAAEKKLRILLTSLVGPSVVSLEGFIQDAREDFYINSYGFWHDVYGAQFGDAGIEPTQGQIRAIRGTLWHGASLRRSFEPLIESTVAASHAAVTQASLNGISWKLSSQILDQWESSRSGSLFTRVKQCLSDQDKLADTTAMTDALAPQYRPKPGSKIPGG